MMHMGLLNPMGQKKNRTLKTKMTDGQHFVDKKIDIYPYK